ncbi:hypothetical protein LK12_11275 [Novosphingobium malaysiense]|uniref:Pilus assembly protein n=1 Tax=Novosphingobium malaysiense TaxID=1348853 RepID=A0A0B1ZQ89_9SPHN|nr:hypothetical protein LK12_11275 [Novosphingobium malaysiense]
MTSFQRLSNIIRDARGASSVEYGIILGMIVLVIFVAMQGVANETIGLWTTISNESADAIAGN